MSKKYVILIIFTSLLYFCNSLSYTHVSTQQYTPPANHCLEGIHMKSQSTSTTYWVSTFDATFHFTLCLFSPSTEVCMNYTEPGFKFIAINKDLTDPTSNQLCSLNMGKPRPLYAMVFYINTGDPEWLDYQYVFSNGASPNPLGYIQMLSPNLTAILGGPGPYSGLVSNCKESQGSTGSVIINYGIICSYQVVDGNSNTSLFFLGVSHYHMDGSNVITLDSAAYFSDYLDPGKGYGDYFNRRSEKLLNIFTTNNYIFVTVDQSTNTFILNYTNKNYPLTTYSPYMISAAPDTILSFHYDMIGYIRLVITAVINSGGSEYLKFWFITVCAYDNLNNSFDIILSPPINIVTSSIPHFDSGYHEFAMVKTVSTNTSKYMLVNVFSTNTAVLDWTNEVVTVFKIISHGQFFAIFDIIFSFDTSYPSVPVINADAFYLYGYTYESGDLVNGLFKTTTCIFRSANAYNTFDNSRCRNYCLSFEVFNVSNKSCDRCPLAQYMNLATMTCVAPCPALTVADNVLMTCYTCQSIGKKYENGICVVACTVSNYGDFGTYCDLCPNGLGVNTSHICIDCSTISNYLYNGICYTSCPAGTYASGNICTLSCSSGTNINPASGNCVVCSTILLAIYNGVCSQCPSGLGIDKNTNTCVDCAIIKQHLESGYCVSQCRSKLGLILQNNTCVNCLTISQYYLNGICISQIPIGYSLIDSQYNIIDTCKNQNLYLSNGKCVRQCPNGTKLTVSTNTCDLITLCSDGSINYNDNCVPCLYMNQVYYNKECIATCPIDYIPDEFGICKLTVDKQIEITGECLPPNSIKFNNECLSICPSNTIPDQINNTRIDCKRLNKAAFNNECIDQCPSTYINVNGSCSQCTQNNMFLYNDQCITSCPANTISSTGSLCTAPTCSNDLCNGGYCSISFNQVTCTCADGKTGSFCQLEGEQIKQTFYKESNINLYLLDSLVTGITDFASRPKQTDIDLLNEINVLIKQMPSLIHSQTADDIYNLASK
jgi:hypothetical protein